MRDPHRLSDLAPPPSLPYHRSIPAMTYLSGTLPLLLITAGTTLANVGQPPRFRQITTPNIHLHQIVIRDIDGDTLPDIYLHPGNTTSILIRNLGNRTFSPPSRTHYPYFTSDTAESLTTLVELDGENSWHVFLHRNDRIWQPNTHEPVVIPLDDLGSFGKRIPLAGTYSTPWIPLDLDQDHRTEFLQIIPSSGQTELKIWDRQANGTYTSQSLHSPGELILDQAELHDLDLDGAADLLLRREDYHDLYFFKRTGLRSFVTPPRKITTNFQPATPTDLDGDGLPDLHSFIQGPLGSFKWAKNTGNGQFPGNTTISVPIAYQGWQIIRTDPRPSAPAHFLVYDKVDPGTFHIATLEFGTWNVLSSQTIQYSQSTPEPGPIVASGDFDQDGHPDLLIDAYVHFPSWNFSSSNLPLVSWGGPDGTFSEPEAISTPALSTNLVVIGDFNGDGTTDIICGPDHEGALHFMPNPGNGRFPQSIPLSNLRPTFPDTTDLRMYSLLSGDINGDSIPDLAIGWLQMDYAGETYLGTRHATAICLGNGDGTFHSPVFAPGAFEETGDPPWQGSLLTDWDLDGDLDLITGGNLMENTGSFFSLTPVPLISGAIGEDILGNPTRIISSTVGDLDGDGFPDISSACFALGEAASDNTFAIAFGGPGGQIQETRQAAASMISTDILGNPLVGDLKFADIDNDGHLDICTQEITITDPLGYPLSTPRWRKNPGGGSRDIASWQVFPLGENNSPFPSHPPLDFDGDGELEWVSLSGYLKPSANGPQFSPPVDLTAGSSAILYNVYSGFTSDKDVIILPADFDGDGDADFLVSNKYHDITLVLNPTVEERSAITRHLIGKGVPPHLASPSKDADGDGIDNRTELFFGSDPSTPGEPALNPFKLSLLPGQDSSFLQYRLPVTGITLGFDYQIECSPDLVNWQPYNPPPPDIIPIGPDWAWFSRPITPSAPASFYRIRATDKLAE